MNGLWKMDSSLDDKPSQVDGRKMCNQVSTAEYWVYVLCSLVFVIEHSQLSKAINLGPCKVNTQGMC